MDKNYNIFQKLLEKCSNFYPNNFKFCVAKKNYQNPIKLFKNLKDGNINPKEALTLFKMGFFQAAQA